VTDAGSAIESGSATDGVGASAGVDRGHDRVVDDRRSLGVDANRVLECRLVRTLRALLRAGPIFVALDGGSLVTSAALVVDEGSNTI
jgi:hypothetical protein